MWGLGIVLWIGFDIGCYDELWYFFELWSFFVCFDFYIEGVV